MFSFYKTVMSWKLSTWFNLYLCSCIILSLWSLAFHLRHVIFYGLSNKYLVLHVVPVGHLAQGSFIDFWGILVSLSKIFHQIFMKNILNNRMMFLGYVYFLAILAQGMLVWYWYRDFIFDWKIIMSQKLGHK